MEFVSSNEFNAWFEVYDHKLQVCLGVINSRSFILVGQNYKSVTEP